jgi:hypothetical protein
MLVVLRKQISSMITGTLLITGLAGCGGSGGSDTAQSGGLQSITVTSLSSQPNKYNEHQTITLSLNTQGKGVNNVTYNWVVEHAGTALTFSGQGTQAISFAAPEVDDIETVRVSVTLGLNDGDLLGNKRYSTSLIIYDLDPLKASTRAIIENGLSTSLVEVDSLNTSLISEGTTWRLNRYDNHSTLANFSFLGERYIATQQITYFDKDNAGDVGFRNCGSNIIEPFAPSLTQITCGGTFERKFYQSTTAFRVEESCNDKVGFANNFTKLRDTQTDSFGQVSLTLTNYNDFSTTANLCGVVTEVLVISHEDDNNDGNPDNLFSAATFAELHGQYEGSPIKISIKVDDVKSYWSYFLEEFLDRDNRNDIKIVSLSLNKLSNISAADGSLGVDRTSTGIEVDVDAEFEDVDGTTVDVDGTFSLVFE